MARQRPLAGQRARSRVADQGAAAAPDRTDSRGRRPDDVPPAPRERPGRDRATTPAGTALIDRPGPSTTAAPRGAEGATAEQPRVLRLGLHSRLAGLAGWSPRARVALVALVVLALVALAAFATVALRVRRADQVETARDAALASAQEKTVDLLSYDYRHLDRDFATARRALTGGFAKDYTATTSKVVRPGALQYHAVVKAEVAASSVVSASADRVVVLVFVNQTTTSTRLDGPKVDLNRVRLTMSKVGGDWLVSDVQAL